jgi:hypothetical protein
MSATGAKGEMSATSGKCATRATCVSGESNGKDAMGEHRDSCPGGTCVPCFSRFSRQSRSLRLALVPQVSREARHGAAVETDA